MKKHKQPYLYICLCFFVFCISSHFSLAGNFRIYGYVVNSENKGLEFVNVFLKKNISSQEILVGATTNRNGFYDILYPSTDSFVLVCSMLGYKTIERQIVSPADILNINIILYEDTLLLEGVEVRALRHSSGMMENTDMSIFQDIPSMSGSDIESILITFAGVNQNNELSTQYNVRGGNFDENQIYVNGIEIRRPLLIRSGQQEGLSFVNPNMVSRVDFSAGGYGVSYGDRMSSVLDIEYKRPQKFESALSISLLGVDGYVGSGTKRYSQMHGIRYKTSAYMLGGLKTEGNYQPNFLNYQTYHSLYLTKNNKWSMSFIGDISQNTYRFIPKTLQESFGTISVVRNITIFYDGGEKDKFLTAFGAFSVHGHLSKEHSMSVDAFAFYSHEKEAYDITSSYTLTEGEAPTGTSSSEDKTAFTSPIASGIFHEHARNKLSAIVTGLSFSGKWKRNNNLLSYGINAQWESIWDRVTEWEWRDSAGYSLPYTQEQMRLYYTLRGQNNMNSARIQGYVENSYKSSFNTVRLTLTAGVRFNWWSYTNEVIPSPRVSLIFTPKWNQEVIFRLGGGLYYQTPFYKELRDTITESGVTRIRLNNKLKAQRATHTVFGTDYYFRAFGRPFKFTAELYHKYIDRMISYTVDNVRIRYSGENDSRGYIMGLDMKVFGELVPGVDSWINFSLMRGRQQVTNADNKKWLHLPQEQRYSFSMLFQDYFPKLPQLLFHIKFIWSDGLPFSSPYNRMAQARTRDYRRIDIGVSYRFNKKTSAFMRAPSAKHVKEWACHFEVFNLVGWENIMSYMWIEDAYNQSWAVPNYLTGRRFNVRISVNLN